MNYEGRACRRRKKRSARVEVKTTPNHNEKEEKQANDQRALFDLREHGAFSRDWHSTQYQAIRGAFSVHVRL
jgi:hypothetical protein